MRIFKRPAHTRPKPFREYSKLVTTSALIAIGVILLFSMTMIAVTGDTSALEWLIGFATTAGMLTIRFYMRRAEAKDKLELCKKYGTEIYESSGAGNDDTGE